MNPKETRQKILEFLYQKNEEGNKQVDYEDLQENINASAIELENAIRSLIDDDYVQFEKFNTGYCLGFIEKKGLDFIEKEIEKERGFFIRNIEYIQLLWKENNHKTLHFLFVTFWSVVLFFLGIFFDNWKFGEKINLCF